MEFNGQNPPADNLVAQPLESLSVAILQKWIIEINA